MAMLCSGIAVRPYTLHPAPHTLIPRPQPMLHPAQEAFMAMLNVKRDSN